MPQTNNPANRFDIPAPPPGERCGEIWRQPATFVRDMEKYPRTVDRLRAMRAKYPPTQADTDQGDTFARRGSGVGDPAFWFGAGNEGPNVSTDEKTGEKHLNYSKGHEPFRFVGYADDLLGSRVRDTGPYAGDEFGDTCFRGVVFRIPGKYGRARYVVGWEFGEHRRSKGPNGWEGQGGQIQCGHDGEYWIGEEGDWDGHGEDEGVIGECARCADSLAHSAAEHEREYQESENQRIAEEEAAEAAQEEADSAERIELADMPTNGAD